ncbi:hypothetical protein ACSBR1_016275 [Camellia fascicularis]
MSKKKVSGSSTTMTLKDFHGGSIPSDLPLPSAPGLIVKPSDRPSFDRQGSWGNPNSRSDHRLRPGSAGAVRNFDDKTPFLSPSAHIGRNFDEDERKPLDGVSGPRRMVSDESIRALPIRTEVKPVYSSTGRLPTHQISSPASQLSSSSVSSHAGRVAETTNLGGNSQNFGGNTSYSAKFSDAANVGVNFSHTGGNSGQAVSGMHPNAWAIRKEAVSTTESLNTMWSGPNAASKLAHASALEKVSSGRWQSKQSIHHPPTDVEVIRHAAVESEFHSKGDNLYTKSSYHPMDVADRVEYDDAMLVRHAERSLTVDHGIRGGGKELPTYERARSPIFPETVERNTPSYVEGVHPARNNGKFSGLELQSPVPLEQAERPKLKLLPRSKPLEGLEPPVDYKKGYQQTHNSDHLENVTESYGNANHANTVLPGSDSGNRAVERPKLNLKPRSQPLEQSQGNSKNERTTVFGGAQPANRVKQDVPRTETVPTHSTPSRYNEKAENNLLDNRIRKNNDRRDNHVDIERTDMQRKNWRSDNWRNRETEKHHHHHHQQLPQERPSSPETWRKPAEQPKPSSPDNPSLRYGKAASAVELAQAFSRSVSDPKTAADRFPAQRGIPGRAQIPFSRLMDPTSRPQINGY